MLLRDLSAHARVTYSHADRRVLFLVWITQSLYLLWRKRIRNDIPDCILKYWKPSKAFKISNRNPNELQKLSTLLYLIRIKRKRWSEYHIDFEAKRRKPWFLICNCITLNNPTGNLNGSNVLVVLPLTKLKKSVNVSRIFKKMVNGACPQYFDDYVTFDIEGPVDFH